MDFLDLIFTFVSILIEAIRKKSEGQFLIIKIILPGRVVCFVSDFSFLIFIVIGVNRSSNSVDDVKELNGS
jgi:hypothetical protein